MLKKLLVYNFQPHERSEFIFSRGINVILGDPQSGKTSGILRPIRLLLKNRPFGGRFFSNFAGEKGKTKVKLFFTEGGSVSVEKTIEKKEGKKNLKNTKYVIVDENNKRTSFPKVGKKVPDKVLEKINLSDLNLQEELDIPFLMTESGSEVTKVINRITHFEKIDLWMASLTSKINKSNKEIEILKGSISSAEKEREKYKNLSKMKRRFEELKKINIKIMNENEKVELLYTVEEGVKEITEDIKKENIIEKEKKLKELIKINKKIEKFKEESLFLQTIVSVSTSVIEWGKKYRDLKKEYIDLLRRVKICPTCFSKIGRHDIDKIKGEI